MSCFLRLEIQGFRSLKILVCPHSFKENIDLPLSNLFLRHCMYQSLCFNGYYSCNVRLFKKKELEKTSICDLRK